ncbi:MAG: benzoyl-CoA reductase subunit C [Planctomycetes bacterium]|nr:benzoyl-CoA reductase subunit C [Planctomycetota bacterium]
MESRLTPPTAIGALIARCEELIADLDLGNVRAWRAAHPGRVVIGYLPIYAPRELVHAAGGLPVGIVGAGEELEIVRGDACFQSYICHLPRSVIELGLSGKLDSLDGMIFPSTCDVIRNLSGIWSLSFPKKWVRYLDLPQNFDASMGGVFYRGILEGMLRELCELSGVDPKHADLRGAIRAFNANRRALRELYALRAAEPWRAPTSEVYVLVRAGLLLPVEEHTTMVERYLGLAKAREARPLDNARVALRGAFCEQPPIELVKTLERAGCYVVDDDFLPMLRWPERDVDESGDPLDALVAAWLDTPLEAPSRYTRCNAEKGQVLIDTVRSTRAEGVIFAAPSFCDPALLDRPMLLGALDRAKIVHTSFKYAENTGQMQPIREQAGTFADSIKLWGEA